ncbi:MAG: internal scaffolding protein [Microvirus sp.]|nr:MAG: internal scaffolding protein [Microvirus sp.]
MENNRTNSIRRRVQIDFGTETKTQQQFAEQADINYIVGKYKVTGEMPEFRQGTYMDVTDIDYHTAMNTVISAQEKFMALPVKIRNEFENSPLKLIQFLQDRNNLEKAVALGLVKGGSPTQPKPQATENLNATETK